MSTHGRAIRHDKVLLVVNSNAAVDTASNAAADYYIAARGLTSRKLAFDMGSSTDRVGVVSAGTASGGTYVDSAWTCSTAGAYAGQGFLTALRNYILDNAIDAVVLSSHTPTEVSYCNVAQLAGAAVWLVSSAGQTYLAGESWVSVPGHLDLSQASPTAPWGSNIYARPGGGLYVLDGSNPVGYRPNGIGSSSRCWESNTRLRVPSGRLGWIDNRIHAALTSESLAEAQRMIDDAVWAEGQDNTVKRHFMMNGVYGANTADVGRATTWTLAAFDVPFRDMYAPGGWSGDVNLPPTRQGVLTSTSVNGFPQIYSGSEACFGFLSMGGPPAGPVSTPSYALVLSGAPVLRGAWAVHHGSASGLMWDSLAYLGLGCAGVRNRDEPYTTGIVETQYMVGVLMSGFCFAEAVFYSDSTGGHQCVTGDPLYAPYRNRFEIGG